MAYEYISIVKKIDTKFNVMEVEYRVDGKDPVLVGMPLPLETQTQEEIIAQYYPSAILGELRSVMPGSPPTITFPKINQ